MKILWSDFALTKLDEIFDYYCEKAGEKIALNLIKSIQKKVEELNNAPLIGQAEPLLINEKEDFRYLVCKSYKIIYDFDKGKNVIRIWHIFHTKQNPKKLRKFK